MAIPIPSLNRLPPGATYRNKSGRASATVEMRGDTVLVTANCDSIYTLLMENIYELDQYKRTESVLKTEISNRIPVMETIGWCAGAFIAGVLAALIGRRFI